MVQSLQNNQRFISPLKSIDIKKIKLNIIKKKKMGSPVILICV